MNKGCREDQNATLVNQELLKTAAVKKAGITFPLLLPSPQKVLWSDDLPKPYTEQPQANTCKGASCPNAQLISHQPFRPVQKIERKNTLGTSFNTAKQCLATRTSQTPTQSKSLSIYNTATNNSLNNINLLIILADINNFLLILANYSNK